MQEHWNFSKAGSAIRLNHWWLYKGAPLLGIMYLFLYVNQVPAVVALKLAAAFVVAIIGIAGSGYFINDLFDANQDLASGKSNSAILLTAPVKVTIAILLFAMSIAPWFYLPGNWIIWALIGVQYLLYFLYSHPIFRFKEKQVAGLVCDAFYGHMIPVAVVSLTFYQVGSVSFKYFYGYMILALTWQVVKGIRNILLHQLDDRKNDRHVGIHTFVTVKGPVKTVDLINLFLLPMELALLIGLLFIITINAPFYYLSFAAFIVYIALYFCAWKFGSLPSRDFNFKFLYVLNDYYEIWMPITSLFYLASVSWLSFLFPPAHLALFPQIFTKFKMELNRIRYNLKYLT